MLLLEAFFAANSKREMQARDLQRNKSILNPYYYFNKVTCFDNHVLLLKICFIVFIEVI